MRAEFEAEVQGLLAEHRPGRLIATRPALAQTMGMPPYTAEEWREAREMVRTEAKTVRFRIEQAAGIVTDDEPDSKRAWMSDLVEALPAPEINIIRF